MTATIQTVLEALALGTARGIRLGEPLRAGALALVPVFHEGPSRDYLTYAEAEAAQRVAVSEVGEVGSVPNLLVENRAQVPLLLVEGEIFVGLKQNRVLNTTILVAAMSKVQIPVACVEAGRWRRDSGYAAPGKYHLSPSVRTVKNRSVAKNVRAVGQYAADQGAVWAGIGDRLASHGVDSASDAFTAIGDQRDAEIERELRRIEPQPGQAGVLALVGGEPICLDVFDRATTLERMWRGLVGSYLTDALLGKPGDAGDEVARAEKWLAALSKGQATEHAAVGLGQTVEVTADAGTVTALVADETVVHLAALPSDTEVRDAKFASPSRRRS